MVAQFTWTTGTYYTFGGPWAYDADLVQLAGGNYLLVYSGSSPYGGFVGESTHVVGRMYDGFRQPLGDPFQLNALRTAGDQYRSEVSALDDGGYLVTYYDEDTDSTRWEEYNAASSLDAGGSLPGGYNTPVSPWDLGDPTNSHLSFTTRLGLNEATDKVTLHGRFYNNDTNSFTSETSIISRTVDADSWEGGIVSQVALSNGNFASAFRIQDKNGDDLVAAVSTQAGTLVGTTSLVINGAGAHAGNGQVTDIRPGTGYQPDITALADGGFVVAWAVKNPSTSYSHDIKLRVMNADGSARTGTLAIASDIGWATSLGGDTPPQVVGFADGGFGIFWSDDHLLTPDEADPSVDEVDTQKEIYYQLFSSAGVALTNANVFTAYASALTYDQAVAANWLMDLEAKPLSDGRMVLQWLVGIDPANSGSTSRIFEMHSTILDPRDALGVGNQPANATSGADTIYGTAVGDLIQRSGGADKIHAWAGDDTVKGSFVNGAVFDGGTGIDTLDFGGLGPVAGLPQLGSYTIDLKSGTVTFPSGKGTGSAQIKGFEIIQGSDFAETITDDNHASVGSVIRAGGGNDVIRIGIGPDTVWGEGGNDTFRLLNAGNNNSFDGGPGSDTFDVSESNYASQGHRIHLADKYASLLNGTFKVTLTSVENGTGGSGADVLVGDNNDNVLKGGGGGDSLRGGIGIDTLRGEAGDDQIDLSPTDLMVGEIIDGGADTDRISLIGSGVHNLHLAEIISIEELQFSPFGTVNRAARLDADQFGAGLSKTASVVGHSNAAPFDLLDIRMNGAKSLDLSGLSFKTWGHGGDYVMITGGNGAETIKGTTQTNRIGTAGGDDLIEGDAGVDMVDGGADTDTVSYVDSKKAVDVSLERAVTISGIAYTGSGLRGDAEGDGYKNVENIVGSAFADRLVGDSRANVLDGGGGGADLMTGGRGNDTYIIDHFDALIADGTGQGTDTVKASVTFYLASNDEIEFLQTTNAAGTRAMSLKGNALAQEITGNDGRNSLSGGAAGKADTLIGRNGDDTYFLYNSDDSVVETTGQGHDAVRTLVSYTLKSAVHVEELTTTSTAGTTDLALYGNEFDQLIIGNAGDNSLRGYGGDDDIRGGAGDDRISGGEGNDIVAGNSGADIYYFSYALDAATNVDTISGFSSIDLISLSSAIFDKAGPAGSLATAAFRSNTTGLAGDASDRIIFDTDTGNVFYDPDGTGAAAATLFAVITGNTGAINAGDFVIA